MVSPGGEAIPPPLGSSGSRREADMLRRTLSLLALVAAAAPLAGRADDWDREWEEDYTEQQQPYAGSQQPGDYDVSVDMNAGAVTFDTFHGPLAPYGDWVVAGGYG